MTKIFKYQLENLDLQQIVMPVDSEIICIQTQNEIPCIWAIVNTCAKGEFRTFEIFGTGQEIMDDGIRKYVGTYQLQGGSLVFHCFEKIQKP